ncbi:MAG: cohesin domain-containing protein, partial [Candidatus Bathyarchaeota archaeon]|jgi:PKD repeat protein
MIMTSIAYFNGALIVKAQADPQIVIEPDSYTAIRVGENFNIDVNIYDLEAIDRVVGIQFRVQYNTTLLEALNVTEGAFMQQFNNTVVPPYTFFTNQIEDDPIYGPNVLVGVLLLPNGTGQWTNYPEGNGTLATITFKALYRPPEPTTASCILNLNDTMVMDEDLNELTHTTISATYEASQLPQPSLTVNPSEYTASLINEVFQVDVNIEDLDPDWRLVGAMFRLQYNASHLEALNVTEGAFMQQFNNTVVPPYTFFIQFFEDDPRYGPNVLVGVLLLPNGTGQWTNYPEGNGTLATITFKAITQSGAPDIPVTSMLVLNDTQLIDDETFEIPHVTVDCTYSINVLSFTYTPIIPISGEPVYFTAPDANYTVTYSWDFGDGTSLSGTERTIGHIYAMPGHYNISLTVTAGGHTSDPALGSISIWPTQPTMDLTVDVGSIHFGGEIAEFTILTTNSGQTVNATKLEAFLYSGSVLLTDLTSSVQQVDTGLYMIQYNIPIDALPGTYTLLVKAEYHNAIGASIKSFQINPTLVSWDNQITTISGDIATILVGQNIIQLNLTAINARLVGIEGSVAVIDSAVGTLQADLSSINATLVGIEGDITMIDSAIAVVDSAVGDLQIDLNSIGAEVSSINGDIATISTTLGDIEVKIDGVQSTATTTLYTASIISAIAAILAALILFMMRKG